MSIEKTPDGSWRVRWREAGRNRSRVIGRKRDAEAFDAEMRRRRRMGEIASYDGGKITLAATRARSGGPTGPRRTSPREPRSAA